MSMVFETRILFPNSCFVFFESHLRRTSEPRSRAFRPRLLVLDRRHRSPRFYLLQVILSSPPIRTIHNTYNLPSSRRCSIHLGQNDAYLQSTPLSLSLFHPLFLSSSYSFSIEMQMPLNTRYTLVERVL